MSKMSNQQLAKQLLDDVGGAENVIEVMHCVTRLRFRLRDDKRANTKKISALEQVMSVQNQGGQYQIVIGMGVPEVYAEVDKLLKQHNPDNPFAPPKKEKPKGINALFDVLSSIIVKPMYAIAGAGILKGLLYMFSFLGWIDDGSTFYAFLNMIGDCGFVFMPFLLAISAAEKFDTNKYLALTIAAAMQYPAYVASIGGEKAIYTLFNIPVPAIAYASTLIPIILSVWVMSYVYRFFDKYIPKVLSLFVTPLAVLLIMIPLAMMVLGPIGTWAGDALSVALQFLFDRVPWLVGIIVGGARPLLVIVGMHHAIRPLTYQQLATYGYNMISPLNFMSTMAQATASLASAFIVKDKQLRALAISSAVSGYIGITEPALYSVLLRLKRPLYACIIGGSISGAFVAAMGTKSTTHTMSSVFSIPIFFGDTFIWFMIGFAMSVVITFVLTILFGTTKAYKEEEAKLLAELFPEANAAAQGASVKKSIISSPMDGTLLPLEQVADKTFAQGVLGKGIGIKPQNGKIYAPVSGRISLLSDTLHAVGIISEDEVELLIHVGMNTVNLKGEGFTAHVKSGDEVQQGDLLLEVDLAALQAAGYDTTTCLLVSNSDQYLDVMRILQDGAVSHGNDLLCVVEARALPVMA